MAYKDLTLEFQNLVQDKLQSIPPNKRRRVSRPFGNEVERTGYKISKEYAEEACQILAHITDLSRMLASIRKPYLNVDSRHTNPFSQSRAATLDFSGAENSWANVKHLTNNERDQIDIHARTILSRCADRVKNMEMIEKRRAEFVVKNFNPLARLLPARLRQDDTSVSSDFLAAHHASIIWYVSRRLTEVSQTQKEMQEERVKRQLERSRTLGSSAAHAANLLGTPESQASKSSRTQDSAGSPGWFASGVAATIGAPLPGSAGSSKSTYSASPVTPSEFDDDEDDDIELSQSQIMQFEAENATMLRAVQDTLESVQQAESRLMDISALQMELVNRLTQQTELTDQLYEDAIATTSTVEKGNVQLREARRRSRDSRKWILLFLIGASLSLLFLHHY